jgi:PAP_fibrillin
MPKSRLLVAIADTNRGISATIRQQQAILSAITQLESDNPHSQPLTTAIDLLAGNWRLLYTSSQSLLKIDRFPLIQLGEIYQYIDPTQAKLYNIAEITSIIPSLNGLVTVIADFIPTSDKRVNVRFNRSLIGLQSLMNYHSPLELIQQIETSQKFTAIDLPINAQRETPAWLEITYLDDTLRIGRGNEGNVFVLVRA